MEAKKQKTCFHEETNFNDSTIRPYPTNLALTIA